MANKSTYRSDALRSAHLAAQDLHAVGAIDKATMRRFGVREHACGERKAPRSLLDAIADDSEDGDFDFDPRRLEGPIGVPVDLCDPDGDKTT